VENSSVGAPPHRFGVSHFARSLLGASERAIRLSESTVKLHGGRTLQESLQVRQADLNSTARSLSPRASRRSYVRSSTSSPPDACVRAARTWHSVDDGVNAGLQRLDRLIRLDRSLTDEAYASRVSDQGLRSSTHLSTASAPSLTANDLQLLSVIGKGSFGLVYLGLWGRQDVAVKVVEVAPGVSQAAVNPQLEACLTRSAALRVLTARTVLLHPRNPALQGRRWLSRDPPPDSTVLCRELRHPNIVITYDSFWHHPPTTPAVPVDGDGAVLVIIMEFCDLGSLEYTIHHSRLFRSERRALATRWHVVAATLLDIAWGLVHLHESGVIHGDLKAGNVMLKADASRNHFTAKLADLGLAKAVDGAGGGGTPPLASTCVGTLSHAAPEVLRHGRSSCEGDVYAFGVLLYELVTANRPFEGLSPAVVVEAVLSGAVASDALRIRRRHQAPSGLTQVRFWVSISASVAQRRLS